MKKLFASLFLAASICLGPASRLAADSTQPGADSRPSPRAQPAGAPVEAPPARAVANPNPGSTVPPVRPERVMPAPAAPARAQIATRADEEKIARAIPQVEAWWTGSKTSQAVRRERNALGPVLTDGSEPLLIRLTFHPSLAGRSVLLSATPGLALNPQTGVAQLGTHGEVVLEVTLHEQATAGRLYLYAEGVRSELVVARFTPVNRFTGARASAPEASR